MRMREECLIVTHGGTTMDHLHYNHNIALLMMVPITQVMS